MMRFGERLTQNMSMRKDDLSLVYSFCIFLVNETVDVMIRFAGTQDEIKAHQLKSMKTANYYLGQ